MNKAIDEILKQYPYLMDDIHKEQEKLNQTMSLQQEARDPLQGQIISDAPHVPGGNVSDQTLNAIEKIIDLYQAQIDECVIKINELLDRKKWLDKAYMTLTEDERRILYLRYDERWPAWRIMQRLGIEEKHKFYRVLDSAKDKINKIMFM
jgi:DNA-directed RNA polymerase specialized sigma subunit